MKVNIILAADMARGGFVNVSPNLTASAEVAAAPLNGLDEVVCAGEAEELVADNVLPAVDPARADECLAHWASRVRVGGTLTVGATDLYEVAEQLLAGTLSQEAAGQALFGGAVPHRAAFSLPQLAAAVVSLGFEPRRQYYAGCVAYVVAERKS
jgi:hypothetical protein